MRLFLGCIILFIVGSFIARPVFADLPSLNMLDLENYDKATCASGQTYTCLESSPFDNHGEETTCSQYKNSSYTPLASQYRAGYTYSKYCRSDDMPPFPWYLVGIPVVGVVGIFYLWRMKKQHA
jgi:membrane protein DedA with SNARE-associated domain